MVDNNENRCKGEKEKIVPRKNVGIWEIYKRVKKAQRLYGEGCGCDTGYGIGKSSGLVFHMESDMKLH